MKPGTSRYGAWEKGVRPFLAIVVTTTLLMAGCASQTAQPIARGQPTGNQIPYRLPTGAKIALTQGRYKHPSRVVHAGPGSRDPRKSSYLSSLGNSRVSWCKERLELPYLPLVMLLYAGCGHDLIFPPKPADLPEVEEEPKKVIILGDVPTEDVSQERKAWERKSNPALGSIQCLPAARAFATSIGALRPLTERVRSYVRGRGLGELAAPPEQGPDSTRNGRDGREMPDYVIEFGVAGVEMHPTHYGNFCWFGVISRGRLIRVKDNSVVQALETEANTNAYPWTPKDVKRLSEELDFALNTVAQRVVDEWLEPALRGSR